MFPSITHLFPLWRETSLYQQWMGAMAGLPPVFGTGPRPLRKKESVCVRAGAYEDG